MKVHTLEVLWGGKKTSHEEELCTDECNCTALQTSTSIYTVQYKQGTYSFCRVLYIATCTIHAHTIPYCTDCVKTHMQFFGVADLEVCPREEREREKEGRKEGVGGSQELRECS